LISKKPCKLWHISRIFLSDLARVSVFIVLTQRNGVEFASPKFTALFVSVLACFSCFRFGLPLFSSHLFSGRKFLRVLGFEMTSYDSQYPWASLSLKRECTNLCTTKRIKAFRDGQALCKDDEKDVIEGICELDEPVCRDGTLPPVQRFTFVYATLFERLGFRLPFSEFEKDLLTMLNVAPAQLHPNSWGFVRAFQILCAGLDINPTIPMFLYFF